MRSVSGIDLAVKNQALLEHLCARHSFAVPINAAFHRDHKHYTLR